MRGERNGNGVSSLGSVLLPLFVGGMVGAGVALLFAPESGRKTRKKVRHLAEDALEKAEGCIEQAKDAVTSVVEKTGVF